MSWTTANKWIAAMNNANNGTGYLGQTNWELPPIPSQVDGNCTNEPTGPNSFGYNCTGNPMGELFYQQLELKSGQPVVDAPDVHVGPFEHMQPYLYWSATPSAKSGLSWSFSFGNGFEGTDVNSNDLYAMVYFPCRSRQPNRRSC